MAVWSEVSFSELSSNFRIDAEYYRPEIIALRSRIEATPYRVSRLENLSSSIINFGAYSLCNEILFQDEGVPFITAENILEGQIDFSSARFISEEQHRTLLRKSQVSRGQVLIAMAARLGYAAVYDRSAPLNSSQDIAKVTLTDPSATNPYYIAAYVNSRLGRSQLLSSQTGSVQQHTNLGKIKDLKVVVPTQTIQEEIAKIFKGALERLEKVKSLYEQAESLLLEELGLGSLDASPMLFYERNFSGTQQAGRFDAEYFQPRFQEAFRILRKQNRTIGDVSKLAKRRFSPKSGVPFHYLEIGDVGGCGHAESNVVAGEDAPSRATWIVREGDVITSTVRPIRRLSALIEPHQSDFVCSSGFAVLTPQAVPAELLLVYLRLPIIAEILDLHCAASMYPAISSGDLPDIPFCCPSDSAVEDIKAKVQQSRSAREESRRLLDKAKMMVEDFVLAS